MGILKQVVHSIQGHVSSEKLKWNLNACYLISIFRFLLPAATKLWPRLCFYTCL